MVVVFLFNRLGIVFIYINKEDCRATLAMTKGIVSLALTMTVWKTTLYLKTSGAGMR